MFKGTFGSFCRKTSGCKVGANNEGGNKLAMLEGEMLEMPLAVTLEVYTLKYLELQVEAE